MPGGRYPWAVRAGGPLLGGGGGGDLPGAFFNYNPVADGDVPGTSTHVRTSTAVYYNGTIFVEVASGVIRDEHIPFAGAAKGFLWEPLAENLCPDSEDLTVGSTFSFFGMSPPTDQGTSEFGLPAWRMDTGTGTGIHVMQYVVAGSGNATASIRAKAVTGRYLTGRIDNSATNDFVVFDLVGGVITETGSNVVGRMYHLGGAKYHCEVRKTTTTDQNFIFGFSNSATPGTGQPSFTGANETIDVCIPQTETTLGSTSPIPTRGGTATRQADSFTDVAWPAESSAIVDVTCFDPIAEDSSFFMKLLGFGSSPANVLAVDLPVQLRLVNGGINSSLTASSSYEGERHSFGMSLKINEGIVVDDENNDNTDVAGTPGQGTIYLGSASDLSGQPVVIHRAQVSNLTQTVAELKALL